MRRVLWIFVALVLLAGVGLIAVVQYVTQVPAKRALFELATRRHINPLPMGETGLGFRREPIPVSFGTVGPGDAAGPACYDADGRPLALEDAAEPEALCAATPRPIVVSGPADLTLALASAQPGDAITLAPGDYSFGGTGIKLGGAGRASAPIIVRAARLGDARLHLSTLEGFSVNRPYWVFENLEIDGVCPDDKDCEHAFHVTGGAKAVMIRNNRLRNFNAAIKINRDDSDVPDDILIERNLIFNTAPRETVHPVTPVDAVAADRVHLVANVIADFAKNGGDRTSYGAFAKGGGTGALFERNLVMCEWRHRGGNRVGLSLGGGGTDPGLCRDRQCAFEQRGGVVRANIVANCGDAGVYLRHAPDSRIENNLLYATRGIEGRFADSKARVVNNIIDGRIIGWAGATFEEAANLSSRWRAAILGRVSESVLADPRHGDMSFRTAGDIERRGVSVEGRPRDFCGTRYSAGAPPIGPVDQRRSRCANQIPGLR